jgi:tocopherol cyclase
MNIWNPEIFQGHLNKKNYFEGWYYKLVSQEGAFSLALIPGVSLNSKDPHAFIQVFWFIEGTLKTYYVKYPISAFSFDKKSFWIQIGKSTFEKTRVDLNIVLEDLTLTGTLTFQEMTPIKQTFWMPNIMGPFAYLGFMEAYHGVISMSHMISGTLLYQNKIYQFTDGKGYLEKDWGTSFPKEYVWMQSNHFKHTKTSFMFSYAYIPFLKKSFEGLICVLMYEGKEYRFSTYQLSKVKKESLSEKKAYYEIKQGRFTLTIEAIIDATVDLPSPKNGVMDHTIKEGLSGHIDLALYEYDTLLMKDTGTQAGIEIMKR